MIASNRRALLPSSRYYSPVHASRARPSSLREERSRRPPAKKTHRVVAVVANDATSTSNSEAHHHGPTCSSTRTLLVAVDESAESKRALIFTLDHMYRPGDVVHLLHVVPRVRPTAAPSGALYYAPPTTCPDEAKVALEKAARAFISREFASLIADRALPFDALAVDVVHELADSSVGETVGDVIIRTAEELDAAALVLLSHEKKNKLEALIWGSVSKDVASRTKRPVILVH